MLTADRILYEDNHLLIVNKLAGEIVQGDKTGDTPLLEAVKTYIKEKYQKPGNVFCGLVHRIDRPVSGAVIFAKTSKALARLNEIVKERKINKIYWALVEGKPPVEEDRLIDYLYRQERNNKTYVSAIEKTGYVRAELSYKMLQHYTHYSLLEVSLYTGRHHQIRAQLSAHGMVIKGDLKYGARRSNQDGSISLHARKIEFNHPVTKELISVTAPLSGEMQKIIAL
jgi:23S rRNA pseudouridine1911/1915/1917 synthase